jgi:hypothetical protein
LANKKILVKLQMIAENTKSVDLTIYGVGNPRSLKESKSFELEILSSDSAYIYSKQVEGIIVKNTQPNLI